MFRCLYTVSSPPKKGNDGLENFRFSTLGISPPSVCYKHLYFLSATKNEEGKGKRKIYWNKSKLERKNFLLLPKLSKQSLWGKWLKDSMIQVS